MRTSLALATLLLGVAAASPADARSIIKDPNPPKYGVEIEPKLNLSYFGLWNSYGGNGWGPGVRFSIPLMSPGFIKKINDSVAISFGADFVHYEGYRYYSCNGRNCPIAWNSYDTSFWSLHLPVTLQWNFWLTEKWSVFAEPGLTVRRSFYKDDPYYTNCDPRFYACGSRDATDLYFTFFVGGRFHFTDNVALTMRLGHPLDFSIGVSFFL